MSNNNNNQEEDLNASNSEIIYEASDFDRSIELILFQKEDRFQLHLWNADTDKAMVIELDLVDIARLGEAIDPL